MSQDKRPISPAVTLLGIASMPAGGARKARGNLPAGPDAAKHCGGPVAGLSRHQLRPAVTPISTVLQLPTIFSTRSGKRYARLFYVPNSMRGGPT